jgi:hypothetical protein
LRSPLTVLRLLLQTLHLVVSSLRGLGKALLRPLLAALRLLRSWLLTGLRLSL